MGRAVIAVRREGSTTEGDQGESAATAAFQPAAAVRATGEHQPVSPRKSLVLTLTLTTTLTLTLTFTPNLLVNRHHGSLVTI